MADDANNVHDQSEAYAAMRSAIKRAADDYHAVVAREMRLVLAFDPPPEHVMCTAVQVLAHIAEAHEHRAAFAGIAGALAATAISERVSEPGLVVALRQAWAQRFADSGSYASRAGRLQ